MATRAAVPPTWGTNASAGRRQTSSSCISPRQSIESGRYPRRPVSVDEHTIELASVPLHYRSAPATGLTPVYLHGLPTSSADFTGLLERTGGVAPDLLG